jgi:hypothetical protein
VALASDATHFYENIERGLPFPGTASMPDILEGFELVRAAADSPQHRLSRAVTGTRSTCPHQCSTKQGDI